MEEVCCKSKNKRRTDLEYIKTIYRKIQMTYTIKNYKTREINKNCCKCQKDLTEKTVMWDGVNPYCFSCFVKKKGK